ncbi:MAG: diaminopimelate decarboxylase [Verrucomicrobiota bacterium]|jgi:diaminopimelate decarboxylase
MHDFRYVGGRLFCEGVSIESLAKKFSTPLYVYSQNTLEDHFLKLDRALAPLDHLICYAMKANSNAAVMRTLANLGSGFDVVSGGELQRVLAAGGDPRRCVFAGVGKTASEIEFALRRNIYCFNVESEPELERINRVAARLKKVAPIAIRVNPNVDAGTHAKITTGTYANKFGIAFEQVEGVYERARRLKNLRLRGVQMHIGSQLTEVKPYELAVKKMLPLAQALAARHGFEFFSIGGGLGIVYDPALESGPAAWWQSPAAKNILTPASYAAKLVPLLQPLGLKILVEHGRFIVGNAGLLVTKVEFVKRTGRKNFVIVDAAMNDLIRPAFYDSYHQILPVTERIGATISSDVVGPICESGDFFAKDRSLPKVGEGDYLALMSAGAYGFVMASNYNTRAFSTEVLVHGKQAAVVRPRQPLERIWAGETIPAWLKQPARSRLVIKESKRFVSIHGRRAQSVVG